MGRNDWFEPEYFELLSAFLAREVRFLIIGGYAVGFYGVLRGTKDLDLWIEVSPDNAQRIRAAIDDLGFVADSLTLEVLLDPGFNIEVGTPPVVVELIKRIAAPPFEDCYARRQLVEFQGLTLPFLQLEDLIESKARAHRYKDLDDIARLTGTTAPETKNPRAGRQRGFWVRVRGWFTADR